MGPVALFCSLLAGIHWFLFGTSFVIVICVFLMALSRYGSLEETTKLVGVLIFVWLVLLILEKWIFKKTNIFPWKVNFHYHLTEDTVDKPYVDFSRLIKIRVVNPVVKSTKNIIDTIGSFFKKIFSILCLIIVVIPFFGIPLLSYPLAIFRWFSTDHLAFWHGFKELLWAFLPIGNIFYVWDIWWDIIKGIFSFIWTIGLLIYETDFYLNNTILYIN